MREFAEGRRKSEGRYGEGREVVPLSVIVLIGMILEASTENHHHHHHHPHPHPHYQKRGQVGAFHLTKIDQPIPVLPHLVSSLGGYALDALVWIPGGFPTLSRLPGWCPRGYRALGRRGLRRGC